MPTPSVQVLDPVQEFKKLKEMEANRKLLNAAMEDFEIKVIIRNLCRQDKIGN